MMTALFYGTLVARIGFSFLVGWMGGHRKVGAVPTFLLSLVFPWLSLGVTALSPYTPQFRQQVRAAVSDRESLRAERREERLKARGKVLSEDKAVELKSQIDSLKKQMDRFINDSKTRGGHDSQEMESVKEGFRKVQEEVGSLSSAKEKQRRRPVTQAIRKAGSYLASSVVLAFDPKRGDDVREEVSREEVSSRLQEDAYPKGTQFSYVEMGKELFEKVSSLAVGRDGHLSFGEAVLAALDREGVSGFCEASQLQKALYAPYTGDLGGYSLFTGEDGVRLYRGRSLLVKMSSVDDTLFGCSVDFSSLDLGLPFERGIAESFLKKDYLGILDAVSNTGVYLTPANVEALKLLQEKEGVARMELFTDNALRLATLPDGRRFMVTRREMNPLTKRILQDCLSSDEQFDDVQILSPVEAVRRGVRMEDHTVDWSDERVGRFSPVVSNVFYFNPAEKRVLHASELDPDGFARFSSFLDFLYERCQLSSDEGGRLHPEFVLRDLLTVNVPDSGDIAFVCHGDEVLATISYDRTLVSGIRVDYDPARCRAVLLGGETTLDDLLLSWGRGEQIGSNRFYVSGFVVPEAYIEGEGLSEELGQAEGEERRVGLSI